MIRIMNADGGPSRAPVNFDDPTRQHSKYGFATDGMTFDLTFRSPESELVVAELERP